MFDATVRLSGRKALHTTAEQEGEAAELLRLEGVQESPAPSNSGQAEPRADAVPDAPAPPAETPVQSPQNRRWKQLASPQLVSADRDSPGSPSTQDTVITDEDRRIMLAIQTGTYNYNAGAAEQVRVLQRPHGQTAHAPTVQHAQPTDAQQVSPVFSRDRQTPTRHK